MFKFITLISVSMLCIVMAITSYAQKSDVDVLTAPAFKEKMEKTPDHILLDVRTPGEVKEGIIPGAKIIDFNSPDFSSQLDKLDKGKDYFVYCKVGGRSGKTVDIMKQSGFKHVHDLKGGYTDWVKQGYPVIRP